MTVFDSFVEVDIRVGKIVGVEDFPEARKPAYKLKIDFGEVIGLKKSSAQITDHYSKAELHNKLVFGVVNLPARQIGPFISEVLTLGIPGDDGETVLITPDKSVPIGGRLY